MIFFNLKLSYFNLNFTYFNLRVKRCSTIRKSISVRHEYDTDLLLVAEPLAADVAGLRLRQCDAAALVAHQLAARQHVLAREQRAPHHTVRALGHTPPLCGDEEAGELRGFERVREQRQRLGKVGS